MHSSVSRSGYKHPANGTLLLNHVIFSSIKKNSETSLFCLALPLPTPPPALLYHCISPSVYPCASAAFFPSSRSLPGVLCFFASLLDHPAFLSIPALALPIAQYPTSPHPPGPHPFLALRLVSLPLLDSVLFFTTTPSFICYALFHSVPHAVSYLFFSHYTSCWFLIICYSSSLALSLCPVFLSPPHDITISLLSLPLSFSPSHIVCECGCWSVYLYLSVCASI